GVRRLCLLLAMPVLLLSALPGGADGVPPASGQDVLLLTEYAPVLLRMHVLIDGKPHVQAWQRYIDRLFADLDRDRDGFLSKSEAERAPVVAFVESFLQGTLNLEAAAEKFPFDRVDADGDGKISPQEFTAYYRTAGFERVRVQTVS